MKNFKIFICILLMMAPSTAHAAAKALSFDCELVVKPGNTEFLEACGDGNAGIFKIKWSNWGTLSATGIGLYGANDCKPYCAKGTFHYKKVKVILNSPMVIKGKTYLTSLSWWELDKTGALKKDGDIGGWNLYSNFRMMQGKL